MKSASAFTTRAVRAAWNLVRMTAKLLVGLAICFVAVILASGLVYVVTKSMGLQEYADYVLLVLLLVLFGVMMRRRLRRSEYQGGTAVPGGEAHTLGLRRKVQQELSRRRRGKPYPHP